MPSLTVFLSLPGAFLEGIVALYLEHKKNPENKQWPITEQLRTRQPYGTTVKVVHELKRSMNTIDS